MSEHVRVVVELEQKAVRTVQGLADCVRRRAEVSADPQGMVAVMNDVGHRPRLVVCRLDRREREACDREGDSGFDDTMVLEGGERTGKARSLFRRPGGECQRTRQGTGPLHVVAVPMGDDQCVEILEIDAQRCKPRTRLPR